MKKIIAFLLTLVGITSACSQQQYENRSVNDFVALLDSTDITLLDVRTVEEYNEGHIKNAINIDQYDSEFLQKATAIIPKQKLVAVYCKSGRRSSNAAKLLSEAGYEVVNLQGGITTWKAKGLPTTKDK